MHIRAIFSCSPSFAFWVKKSVRSSKVCRFGGSLLHPSGGVSSPDVNVLHAPAAQEYLAGFDHSHRKLLPVPAPSTLVYSFGSIIHPQLQEFLVNRHRRFSGGHRANIVSRHLRRLPAPGGLYLRQRSSQARKILGHSDPWGVAREVATESGPPGQARDGARNRARGTTENL